MFEDPQLDGVYDPALTLDVPPGLTASGGINAIHAFQDMCRYLRANLIGIVHGTASDVGDAQKQPELMERAYQLGKAAGAA